MTKIEVIFVCTRAKYSCCSSVTVFSTLFSDLLQTVSELLYLSAEGEETLKYAYYLHVIALPSINLGCYTQFVSS